MMTTCVFFKKKKSIHWLIRDDTVLQEGYITIAELTLIQSAALVLTCITNKNALVEKQGLSL